MSSLSEFFNGLGYNKVNLDNGNRANPPGDPPVQYGSYEYIQPQLFADQEVMSVGSYTGDLVEGFNDWDEMAVNEFGPSGLTGGGVSWEVPELTTAGTATYNLDHHTYLFNEDHEAYIEDFDTGNYV